MTWHLLTVPLSLIIPAYLLFWALKRHSGNSALLQTLFYCSIIIATLLEVVYIYTSNYYIALTCAKVLLIVRCFSICTVLNIAMFLPVINITPRRALIPAYIPIIYTLFISRDGYYISRLVKVAGIPHFKVEYGVLGESWIILVSPIIVGILISSAYEIYRSKGPIREGCLLISIGVIIKSVLGILVVIAGVEKFQSMLNISFLSLPSAVLVGAGVDKTMKRIPAIQYRIEPSIEIPFEPGKLVLVNEEKPEKLRKYIETMVRGYPILTVSRVPPSTLTGGLKGVVSIWLSELKGRGSIHPTHLSRLKAIIEDFASKYKAAVCVEGIEYLVLYNGFKKVLRFICELKDLAEKTGAMIILSLNLSVFRVPEVQQLKKYADKILEGSQ